MDEKVYGRFITLARSYLASAREQFEQGRDPDEALEGVDHIVAELERRNPPKTYSEILAEVETGFTQERLVEMRVEGLYLIARRDLKDARDCVMERRNPRIDLDSLEGAVYLLLLLDPSKNRAEILAKIEPGFTEEVCATLRLEASA
jgi:hypothetical protein